jgi:Cu/Zn superoxide dismutase
VLLFKHYIILRKPLIKIIYTDKMARCCCVITGKDKDGKDVIEGTLILHQAQEEAPTTIDGTIRGLVPGKHGFHLHVFGDFSEGFSSCGSIFNPFGRNHGAPDDEERMVGDLGNIDADDKLNLSDLTPSLAGVYLSNLMQMI